MPNGLQTFTAPKSVRKLVQIVDYIAQHEGETLDQIVAVLGGTRQKIGDYLRYAADVLELIHRESEVRVGPRGREPFRWKLGAAPKARCQKPKKRESVARDELHQALFGPAKQQNGE